MGAKFNKPLTNEEIQTEVDALVKKFDIAVFEKNQKDLKTAYYAASVKDKATMKENINKIVALFCKEDTCTEPHAKANNIKHISPFLATFFTEDQAKKLDEILKNDKKIKIRITKIRESGENTKKKNEAETEEKEKKENLKKEEATKEEAKKEEEMKKETKKEEAKKGESKEEMKKETKKEEEIKKEEPTKESDKAAGLILDNIRKYLDKMKLGNVTPSFMKFNQPLEKITEGNRQYTAKCLLHYFDDKKPYQKDCANDKEDYSVFFTRKLDDVKEDVKHYYELYHLVLGVVNLISSDKKFKTFSADAKESAADTVQKLLTMTLKHMATIMDHHQITDENLLRSSYNLLYLMNSITIYRVVSEGKDAITSTLYDDVMRLVGENINLYKEIIADDNLKKLPQKLEVTTKLKEVTGLQKELEAKKKMLEKQKKELEERKKLITELDKKFTNKFKIDRGVRNMGEKLTKATIVEQK